MSSPAARPADGTASPAAGVGAAGAPVGDVTPAATPEAMLFSRSPRIALAVSAMIGSRPNRLLARIASVVA